MALFDKKSPLEKIKDLLKDLSEEEKVELLKDLNDKEEESEAVEEEIVEEKPIDEEEKPVEEEKIEDESKIEDDGEVDDEEEEVVDEQAEENQTNDVVKSMQARIDDLESRLSEIIAKVQPYLDKMDKMNEPTDESFGLGKKQEVAKDSDDELSAREYAMKYAKY